MVLVSQNGYNKMGHELSLKTTTEKPSIISIFQENNCVILFLEMFCSG